MRKLANETRIASFFLGVMIMNTIVQMVMQKPVSFKVLYNICRTFEISFLQNIRKYVNINTPELFIWLCQTTHYVGGLSNAVFVNAFYGH